MRLWLCGAATSLLVVLTGAENTLAEDEYANVHTVAVVSEIDHELLVQYVGPTVFIYDAHKLPLGTTISDHAVATVKAALKDRFTVLNDSPPTELFVPNLIGSLSQHQRDQIAALPASARADAYVVIYPLECQQNMGGLTLIHKNGALAGYGTTLCTGTRIAVLDASGKRLDYGTSSDPAACNDTVLAPSPSDMSSAQTGQLTASAENVIDKTLAIAMNSAGLISDSDAKKLDADARRVSEGLPCQWY